jgi:hypothetical protein
LLLTFGVKTITIIVNTARKKARSIPCEVKHVRCAVKSVRCVVSHVRCAVRSIRDEIRPIRGAAYSNGGRPRGRKVAPR